VGEGIAKVRRILSSVDLDILVKLWIPGKSAAAGLWILPTPEL